MSKEDNNTEEEIVNEEEWRKEKIEEIIEKYENEAYDVLLGMSQELGSLLNVDCEFILDMNFEEISKVFRSITTEVDFVSNDINRVKEMNKDSRSTGWDMYDPYLDDWQRGQGVWVYTSDSDKKKKLGDKRVFLGGKEEK